MKMDKLRVLVKRVGQPFKVEEIEHSLEAMQEIVGGFIEVSPCLPHPYVVVCNEEGKLEGLKQNFSVIGDVICGDAIIAKVAGADFVSLDDKDISNLSKMFEIEV